MPLQTGDQAPDFTLPDEIGVLHRLSDYRGKMVLIYFYPKDNTSGCSTEACNFRDDYSRYRDEGVVILGISPDPSKSHAGFKTKYNLPYTLLSDVDHKVCELYGSWGRKKLIGREYDGVLRNTYLIDPEGRIVKVFEKVKPAEHSLEVLELLKSIS